MTTAIDNAVMCTHCLRICAASELGEVCVDWGEIDNPEKSRPARYEDQCRVCGHDEFVLAITCAVCGDRPCQCEENDDA